MGRVRNCQNDLGSSTPWQFAHATHQDTYSHKLPLGTFQSFFVERLTMEMVSNTMLFISYSRADVRATKSLAEALLSKSIDSWRDESNIPVGQAFVAELGQALQRSHAFLLLDTPASRRSYWVSREVRTATRYRAEGRYHTLLRIYSAACEDGVESHWDASLPLDTRTCDRMVELLALRSTQRAARGASEDIWSVSIASNGLGQPSNWSGRQDELRKLDDWWFQSHPGAWVQGLGGIGKSGLAQTWITALAYLGYEDRVNATVLYLPGREIVETGHALGKVASWQPRETLNKPVSSR